MLCEPWARTERHPTREAIHELRNLFAIIASARNMLDDEDAGSQRTVLLEAIGKAALRGGELTTDMLVGRARDHNRRIDVNHHVAALMPMLLALAGSDVVLQLELCPGKAFMNIDPDSLEAAVIELVSNARRACRPGGTIRLRTRRHRSFFSLLVADDGCGMSRDRAERLLTCAAPPGAHGSGIGHVRALAAKLHGTVRVRSRTGFGTVVALNLPTVRSVAADESSARTVWTSPQAKEPHHENRQPIAA